MRRRAVVLIAGLILIGVVFGAVFPIRTYLSQRGALIATEKRLAVLKEQNENLSERAARLHSDAEIERLAREQYNLVRPGEEAYAILPPPVSEETDDGQASAKLRSGIDDSKEEPGRLEKLWDGITFWS